MKIPKAQRKQFEEEGIGYIHIRLAPVPGEDVSKVEYDFGGLIAPAQLAELLDEALCLLLDSALAEND